jgi:hypothetical protein
MSKKIRIPGALFLALVIFGSGCTKSKTTVTTTTVPITTATTTPSPSTGSSDPTVYGNTLLFTPQQFVDALSATIGNNESSGTTGTVTLAQLVKSPDLQGANNAVIYDSYNGGYFGVDLSAFTGMSVQQAVSSYMELQWGQEPGAYNQFLSGQQQSMTLPNGKTLSLWVPPYDQPGIGGSAGSSIGSIGSSGGSGGTDPLPPVQPPIVVCSNCSSGSDGSITPPVQPPGPSGNGFVQGSINILLPAGNDALGNPLFADPGNNLYSDNSESCDTDLQQADLQNSQIEQNAQSLVTRFQMNMDSARQLSVLADKMNQMSANGRALTDEDRASLSDAAFAVAGVSGDDVNAAAAKMIQTGDRSSVDELMAKAATNLGMSSATGLKDQILPSLGINIQ